MKLIEKKCPNCGGSLKFNDGDKETKCEYCNKEFVIERDNDFDKSSNANIADAYNISEVSKQIFDDAVTTIGTTFGIMRIVPIVMGIIIFIMFIAIGFGIFKANKNSNDDTITSIHEKVTEYTSDDEDEEAEVIKFKLDDLTDEMKKTINDNTLTIINKDLDWYDNGFIGKHTDPSYVGSYLLTAKDSQNNIFYDVYKIEFKIDGKNVPYYLGVEYKNVKVTDDKLVVDMNGTKIGTYNHDSNVTNGKDGTYGFSSTKDLYNKEVRGYIEDYDVTLVGDLYNE